MGSRVSWGRGSESRVEGKQRRRWHRPRPVDVCRRGEKGPCVCTWLGRSGGSGTQGGHVNDISVCVVLGRATLRPELG